MGAVLHILRAEPDEILAELITHISQAEGARVVCLYADGITDQAVNWQRLVQDIFAHDRVICW